MPLWKRQLDVLRELAPVELLVSGVHDLEYPPDVKVVPDRIEDGGPLAGILSCLKVAQSKLLLVLAVDLPNMNSKYLRSLVQRATPGCGIVPAIQQDLEPVSAEAGPQLAERVDRAIREELLFRAEVRSVAPGSLPRFEMKARRLRRVGENR